MSPVVFSGTQFRLYISTNGFSQIQSGDIQYGPTFNTADFSTDCTIACKAVSSTIPGIGSVTFYIGNIASTDVLEGPIPIQLNSSYNFVKVFDGTVTSVAVTSGTLYINAGLSLNPSIGAAGTTVSASGGGFVGNTVIDLTYSYTLTFFNGTVASATVGNWTTGINTGPGFFTFSGAILNVKQQVLDTAGDNLTSVPITITATLEAVPHTVFATATFTELTSFINEVLSFDASGAAYDVVSDPFVLGQGYGSYNGSAAAIFVPLTSPVGAVSIGSLIIAGNDSAVNSAVTFWVGGTLNSAGTALSGGTSIGNTTSNGVGSWNGTAHIPALPLGLHTVTVSEGGALYWFQIFINPSLVLTPSSGNVGATVSVAGYGFPAGDQVYLYWFELSTGDATYFNLNSTSGALINITIPTNGAFTGFSFFVPHAFGGSHDVSASNAYVKNPTSVPVTDIADTTFTVTPHLTVAPTSVNSNSQTWISALGTGFDPSLNYNVNLDNAQYSPAVLGSLPGTVTAAPNGDLNVTFSATGYRPGWHVVSLYSALTGNSAGAFAPAAFGYFNVTTTGDYISGQLTGIGNLSSSLASLQTSLTNLQTSVTALQASLATITTDVSGLSGQLTTISNNVNSLSGTVTQLSSTVGALSTKLDGIVASLGQITTTLNTAAASAATAATNAQHAADAATAASSGASSSQTYVLVVAVLAAITLVLELAILVRKLS